MVPCSLSLLLASLLYVVKTQAFSLGVTTGGKIQSTDTALFGKARRGKLASLVDTDDALGKVKVSKPQKNRGKAAKSGGSTKKGGDSISPALAQWASQSEDTSAILDVASSEDGASDSDDVASFESFDRKSRTKKNNSKSFRQQMQVERDGNVSVLVDQLLEVLESDSKQKDLNAILNPVRELVSLGSATEQFRTLTAGSKETNNYRLAWVGGDDAISHVGTGLHKVPLARLQEVFLSLPGRNRVQLLEVIRVIGPFPNVKNTLQGESKMAKSSSSDEESGYETVEWNIVWDSMTDGTGKELLAGKAENVQRVLLHVCFADEQVLVAVVPPSIENPSERRKDIFEGDGANILVFVKEEDLDDKLERLRVA